MIETSLASPRLLAVALLAALLAGCMGATADADAGEDEAGGSTADASTTDASTSNATTATTATSSDASAARGPDDGRPPTSGVSGGRETVRETLVVVQPLTLGPIRDEIVVSSRVTSDASVQVFPKLANLPVTDVRVDEGDRVTIGDVLMTLYATELELALETTEAAHDRAAKEVEQARLRHDQETARVVRAERQAQKTSADLERLAGLVTDGLVNRQEVEDARLTAETSQDDLELARFELGNAQLALDLTQINLAARAIDVRRAMSDLDQTTVRAPLTGIVAMCEVEIGELSNLSRPAFRVVDIERPVLELRVPQDALSRVVAGQRVEAKAVTNPDLRFAGTVRTVNPVLDEATGTIHVIVELVPRPGLVPGLFCEARIITAERDTALLIDKRAVRYDDDQPVFFALDEGAGTVSRVPFLAGASTATAIEILSDLDGRPVPSVRRVVVVGHESLKHGARVRVREEAF